MAIEDKEVTEFDIARKRLRQSAGREAEQRKQGLQRRAAQLGGGTGRGTLLKAEQEAERQRGEQIAAGEEQIGAAERAETRRKREIQEQREFITSERLGSEAFATGERLGSQAFTTGEREAAQIYGKEVLDAQIASTEGIASLNRESQETIAGMQIDSNEKISELDRELKKQIADGQLTVQQAQLRLESFKIQENIRIEGRKLDVMEDQFEQTFGLDMAEFEQNQDTILFNTLLSAFEAKGGFVKWLQDSGVDVSAFLGEDFTAPQASAPATTTTTTQPTPAAQPFAGSGGGPGQ